MVSLAGSSGEVSPEIMDVLCVAGRDQQAEQSNHLPVAEGKKDKKNYVGQNSM